jgi:hypothetical protein
MEAQMMTRREALALSTAVASVSLAQSRAAAAQTGKPEWGYWVPHVDTTNSAAKISDALKTADTTAVVLFDRMGLRLQGKEGPLAGSAALAGHFPIKLPPEYPLTGFGMIVRGTVTKTADSDAILTMSIGGDTRVHSWPRTSRVIDVPTKKEVDPVKSYDFDLTCFSGESNLAVGNPPTLPALPPLSLSLGLTARRRTVDEEVSLFEVSSLEIFILAVPTGQRT